MGSHIFGKAYEKALPYNVEMVIPGYEKSYPKGTFRVLTLSPRDSIQWYREFIKVLESAIGSHYLPVCRISDGEFEFALGGSRITLRDLNESFAAYIKRKIINMLVRLIHYRLFHGDFRNMVDFTIPSGIYTKDEWRRLRIEYANMLREISRVGILCPWFSYRKRQYNQQYIVPFVNWLRRNKIRLTEHNYYPSYFVYAMLNGPERGRILGKERILVVTHCDKEKAARIEASLKSEGAKEIQFLQISKNRSIYDVLDLSLIKLPVDVVLVGAGIGKPNILLRLKETKTLCIDAGFVIECLAYPEHYRSGADTRTFCWPDCERNGDYSPI